MAITGLERHKKALPSEESKKFYSSGKQGCIQRQWGDSVALWTRMVMAWTSWVCVGAHCFSMLLTATH